jgi:hypothetical protein
MPPLILTPELNALASKKNRSDIDTLLSRLAKLFGNPGGPGGRLLQALSARPVASPGGHGMEWRLD